MMVSGEHQTQQACADPIPVPRPGPRICFVALRAFNVLSGREDIQHIGGAEVQQVRMAAWLAERGYSVSFVTLDHGQRDGIDLRGIKVFKAYAKADGVRGLRFVHPRWSGLWSALGRADADVYYHRCAEAETGQVALWCRLHHRKLIFASAHDSNGDPRLYALKHSWVERILYRIGIRLAHAITAQTEYQQDLFRRNLGLSTVLIRNCGWDLERDCCPETPASDEHSALRVLWVGRISQEKRPDWLLDVAQQCPEMIFDVVGGANTDGDYGLRMTTRASGIPNVRMHGCVPYAKIAEYYKHCHVLCCTSAHEGFPNTFLEAWALGIPLVSTFDPDGVIAANGLGWVASSPQELAVRLREIVRSPGLLREASRAAARYYRTHHTPDVCLPLMERLFLQLAENGRRGVSGAGVGGAGRDL